MPLKFPKLNSIKSDLLRSRNPSNRYAKENGKEASEPPREPPAKLKRPKGYDVRSVEHVRRKHLTADDTIVAIMGPTGAGKSTFIQKVTGQEVVGVGHSLESLTIEVTGVRVKFTDGVNVVLVDTPGFDDTYRSDVDVLEIFVKWLGDVRRSGLELSGILYLHRISDNRMAATPLKNLDIFKKICGEKFFEKIILTTTMWPEGDDDIKEEIQRENELQSSCWVEMINRGSLIRRFMNTQASAWDILDDVIADESRRRLIRIQKELVDQRKSLPTTEAGQQLHDVIEALIEKQNNLASRTKEALGKPGDPQTLIALLNELSELRKERDEATKLDSSLSGKLRRVSGSIQKLIKRRVAE
ncbi:hypothetical protein P691DRAFT_808225 [Macrolepiota fuliginosa MF-IS2]|uniref:G domain-containing protein n=1 Tax=Macrolepiota fuliginosa MF-IS2 TaxID=1400762 RepID=A0A9P5X623_9AGAR|nr:hypothetical protein P691DRAFT_808225 [Macrolepiota fuliginosa MF-IS2]